MKPTIFLRIASALTLIHAVLHTVGGVFGKQAAGAQRTAVAAMQSNTFLIMGLNRSFWSFYRGLGLAASISMTAEAILFWQLSSLAKTASYRLRPIYATFMIAYLAIAVNSSQFFFPPPVIVEILIALCLAAAIVTSKPATTD